MYKTVFFVAAAALVAVLVSRQCDDGHGLTEAQLQNVACRDILGDWDLYLNSDGNAALGKGMIATGGNVKFSADHNGRFMNMASDDHYWTGTKGCTRSGSTFQLQLSYRKIDFELTSPNELRQIDGGSTSFVFRRKKSAC